MNAPRAPFWVSKPGTNTAKLGGASYERVEDAVAAADASPERPLVVYGSRSVSIGAVGVVVPVVVREVL